MKKTIIFVLISVIGFSGLHAQEKFDKFEIQVDGLGCPFCAYGLEKKFKEFKGIKQVKIEIETGNFTFAYPTEKKLSLEDVEHQVEKAGYTPVAGSVTRADGSIEAMHKQSGNDHSDSGMATGTVKVAGNCEMCKARIEKAALTQVGVLKAIWDKDSKLLTIGYDAAATSRDAIEKAIAVKGHDTEHHRAHEETYNTLPACCHYERIQAVAN